MQDSGNNPLPETEGASGFASFEQIEDALREWLEERLAVLDTEPGDEEGA